MIWLFCFYLSGAHASDCPAQLDLAVGAVVRLTIVHGDGYGDLLNSIDLSQQLKARWPNAEFPLVIDVSEAYKFLEPLFSHFDSRLESNFVYGVEIVDGLSKRGQRVYSHFEQQILRLPAAGASSEMTWGTGKYNLYVEEPGEQRRTIAYPDALRPGQPLLTTDGRVHLRVNPGFAADEFGVSLPRLDPASTRSRLDLLIALAAQNNLHVHPGLARAEWGLAYYHAELKSDGQDYYAALLKSLRKSKQKRSIVIFDFAASKRNQAQESPFTDWQRFRARLAGVRVKHQYPDERGDPRATTWRGSLLTIVTVGPAPHELFLDFLRAATVPVAITGTQSLFESIALDKVFVYEHVPWKMALIYGMAEIALKEFSRAEAEFLIDWLTGRGDQIQSSADIQHALVEVNMNPKNPSIPSRPRFERALEELFTSADRRALVHRFIAKMRERDRLLDTIANFTAVALSYSETPSP